MQQKLWKKAAAFAKQGHVRKAWQRVVSGLTCIVVFCTTYALILPAITMEGDALCTLPEHTHTEECYAQNNRMVLTCNAVHSHDQSCYGSDGTLICGQADFVMHSHNGLCYDDAGQLRCELPQVTEHVGESGAYYIIEGTPDPVTPAHVHSEGCYTAQRGALQCTLTEGSVHVHGTECYGAQVAACGLEETEAHWHAESCYENQLTCGTEEADGHAHTESCYDGENLICGQEEAAAHQHSAQCYTRALICVKTEGAGHTHNASCMQTPLICTLSEDIHFHTDSCYEMIQVLSCGKLALQSHTHSEACLQQAEKTLVCEKEEHTHTLICYSNPDADVETKAYWEATMKDADLTGGTADDLLAIAKTQLGYTESKLNYTVLEDGITTKGYTRYGAWAGTPYADWNELFVEFCLYYAGIDEEDFPRAEQNKTWRKTLTEEGLFYTEGTPEPGDLLFLEKDEDAYDIGIVTNISTEGYITAILGDWENEVHSETFTPGDLDILGYTPLPELPEEPADNAEEVAAATTEPVETTEEVTEPEEATETSLTANMSFELSEGEIVEEVLTVSTFSMRTMALTRAADIALVNDTGTGSVDMTNMITNVEAYHKTSAWGDTWKPLGSDMMVQEGDLIRFAITYQIPGRTISKDNPTITYQLPVSGISEAKSGNVYDSTGMKVGTYTISTTGLITITFDEYYAEENSNGVLIDGVINFDSTAEELDKDGDHKIDLDFTDSESFDIRIEETVRDDLTVTKTAALNENEDGTVSYQITVSSVNGTAGNDITLTDWMSNVSYLKDMQVVKKAADGTTSTVDSIDQPTAGDKDIGMTLPALAAGESYTITYIGQITNVSGDSTYVGNGVTVTSKDKDGNKLTDSADASVTYNNDMVSKTYTKNSDGSLTWTVTVGNGTDSLKDWTLSDQFNGSPLQETVTITKSDGTVVYTGTLPHKFDTDVAGPLTVTYTTNYDYEIGANSVSNTVQLTPPSGNPIYSDSEHVSEPGAGTYDPLSKKSTGLNVVDGTGEKLAKIDWSYTINASLGTIYMTEHSNDIAHNGGTYWRFTDSLQNSQYFADDQWEELESNILEAMLNAFNSESETWTAENASKLYELVPTQNNSGQKTGFTVYVYQNMPKGSTITFTYQSTASLGDGTTQKHFQNQASVKDKVWDSGANDYYPVIMKMDAATNSTADSEHAQMDLTDNTLSWILQMCLPADSTDVVITENLPEHADLTSVVLKLPNTGDITLACYGDTSVTYNGVTYTVTTADATTDGDSKLEISVPDALITALNGQTWRVQVNTQLSDDFEIKDVEDVEIDKVALTNSVTISYKDKDRNNKTDSDDHTQTITNEDTTEKLVKSAGTYANNQVPYTLEINPNADDMNADGDTITITDNLSYWLDSSTEAMVTSNLVPGSVKVYSVDKDTNAKTLLIENTDYTYTYVQSEVTSQYTTWYELVNMLNFTVPDETHLIIEYSYRFVGEEGNYLRVTNVATVKETNYEGQSKTDMTYRIDTSDAEANLGSINVYKVDSTNYTINLEGASFELYKWDAAQNAWVFDHSVVSNGSSHLELENLTFNQAYYLVETNAPDGYILDQSRHYFMIYDAAKLPENVAAAAEEAEEGSEESSDESESESSQSSGSAITYPLIQPDDFPASARMAKGSIIYIPNSKDSTSISAEKTWLDADGNEISAPTVIEDGETIQAQVQLQLMQVWNRYPEDFDKTKLGTSANVTLAFGEYSYDTKVYPTTTIADAKVGDILTVTLVTPDNLTYTTRKVYNDITKKYEWITGNYFYPAGLMEVNASENNHVAYTRVDNGDTSTYVFTYLITGDATLRGWVYPENNEYVVANSSISYTVTTPESGTDTVEREYGTSVTLTGTTWTSEWSNLPVHDLYTANEQTAAGADTGVGRIEGYYSYYVKEVSSNVEGYIADYTTAEDGTLLITNKPEPKTSLAVEKVWLDIEGNEDSTKDTSVSFKLFRTESYLDPRGEDRSSRIIVNFYGNSGLAKTETVYAPVGCEITIDSQYSNKYNEGVVDAYVVRYDGIACPTTKEYDATSDSVTFATTLASTGGGTIDIVTYDDPGWTNTISVTSVGNAKPVQIGIFETGTDLKWESIEDFSDGLPLQGMDSTGKKVYYSYYIEEVISPAYSVSYTVESESKGGSESTAVTGGSITIKNQPVSDLIEIEVEKVWENAGNTTLPDIRVAVVPVGSSSNQEKVRVELNVTGEYGAKLAIGDFEKGSIECVPGTTLTITLRNTWWNTSPPSDPVLSFNQTSYSPTVTDEGYARTFIYEIVVNGDGTLSGYLNWNTNDWDVATITQTEPNVTDNSAEIDVTNAVAYVTLNADNGWKATITGLAEGDYQVVEVTSGNYTVSYTVDGTTTTIPPTVSEGDTVTITNTMAETETVDLTVNKIWLLPEGAAALPESITFKVYYQVGDGEKVLYDPTPDDEVEQTYTVTADSNWSYIVEDLPKTDSAGNAYTYTVEEVAVSGYRADYAYSGTTATITNQPSIEIGVEKVWGMTVSNDATVDITLYRFKSETAPEGDVVTYGPISDTTGTDSVRTVTLGTSTSDGLDKTFKNLPLYSFDEDGKVNGYYTYHVVETTTGYVTTYTKDESGKIIITNSPAYELPKSGGAGVFPYTLGGVTMCGVAVLRYKPKKRRKEDKDS